MLISVIILGYNGKKYVDGCLSSVLDQDLGPKHSYEVLWADNCSTDGSPAYVATHYPSVRLLQFGENLGFAQGNNCAARQAQGDLLVFLNQDTVVHRSWLRALVEVMDDATQIAACQSNMLMPWHREFAAMDRTARLEKVYVAAISKYGFVEYREYPYVDGPLVTVFLTGASFAIRKSVVEQLEYIFDPFFNTYSEDLELSLRLQALGMRSLTVPASVVYHLQFSKVTNYRSALRKAYLSTRNRVLTYYKNLPTTAFVRMLPLLIVGSLIKLNELPIGVMQKAAYMVVMLPITVAAFAGAARHAHRYTCYRKSLTPSEQAFSG